MLVAALPTIAALAVAGRVRRIAISSAGLYVGACLIAGQRAGADETLGVRLRISAAFAVMHFAWGAGFWAGVGETVRGTQTGGGSPPRLPEGPPSA